MAPVTSYGRKSAKELRLAALADGQYGVVAPPGDVTVRNGLPVTRPARTIIDLLEERFLALCDDHGIERPETNALIEGGGSDPNRRAAARGVVQTRAGRCVDLGHCSCCWPPRR
jgi:hypothetical protein